LWIFFFSSIANIPVDEARSRDCTRYTLLMEGAAMIKKIVIVATSISETLLIKKQKNNLQAK
jgi:hypothetical protein